MKCHSRWPTVTRHRPSAFRLRPSLIAEKPNEPNSERHPLDGTNPISPEEPQNTGPDHYHKQNGTNPFRTTTCTKHPSGRPVGRTSWSVSMALLATKIHENPRRSRVGQDGILRAAQRAPRSIAARADWGRPLGPARRLPSGQPAPHRFFDPAFFRWRELEREGRRAHQRCGRPGPPHDMP